MSYPVPMIENRGRVSTHPGKILADYLSDYRLSADEFAAKIGVVPAKINRVLAGRGRVDGNLAQRLGRAFGTTAQYWINMQTGYELTKARKRFLAEYDRIEKLPEVILTDD